MYLYDKIAKTYRIIGVVHIENVYFSYNIVLTILLTIVSTGFYVLYMKNKKRGFLFLTLLYFLIILDNSIIYMSEFSYGFESLYETTDILYIIISLIYLGIVLTIRLIISDFFDDKYTTIEKQCAIVVPIILLVLFIFIPFQISEFLISFSFFYITFLYGL